MNLDHTIDEPRSAIAPPAQSRFYTHHRLVSWLEYAVCTDRGSSSVNPPLTRRDPVELEPASTLDGRGGGGVGGCLS